MSFKTLAVTCLLFLGVACPAVGSVYDDYENARKLYVDGEHVKVIEAVTRLLSSEDLSQTNRANLYTFRGVAYSELENYEESLKDLAAAISLAPKNSLGDIHYQRFFPNFNLGRMDDAYKDMLFVVEAYPDDAQYFRISTITKVANELREKKKSNELFLLLSALDKSNYVGNEPLEFTDWLYLDLLREYVKREQFEDARRLLGKFVQESVLVEIRLDRDFEALWSKPEFADLLDIRDFPRRELDNARLLLEKYPKSWKSVADVTSALRINGRNEEAVSLARSALAKSGSCSFELEHEYWLKNELAYALVALGRFDEADKVLAPIAKVNLKKNGSAVSQILNYGAMLMSQGKTQEAIAVVGKTEGRVSNRGSLVAKHVVACSLQQNGDSEGARVVLAQMLAKDENGVDMVLKTMACLKETEQLEKYAVRKLADDEEKTVVLKMLMKCEINPLAPAAGNEIKRQLMILADRPDVKKAVAAVGTSLVFSRSCSDF